MDIEICPTLSEFISRWRRIKLINTPSKNGKKYNPAKSLSLPLNQLGHKYLTTISLTIKAMMHISDVGWAKQFRALAKLWFLSRCFWIGMSEAWNMNPLFAYSSVQVYSGRFQPNRLISKFLTTISPLWNISKTIIRLFIDWAASREIILGLWIKGKDIG